MPTTSQQPTILSPPQCRERLESKEVGRVGWVSAHRPRILPVSYTCFDDFIVIRTVEGRTLSHLTRRAPVVFEVDDLDETGRRGWSVIVNGFSGSIVAPNESSLVWKSDLAQPWAPGQRSLLIAITIETVTGRVFGS
ncbi:MAG: pyridoxamine 5'-phosphate oxidase family protein [Humibacillus sp.]|nr:pyridoxamine 5'-phosphate oxidase family protein [Humibacillus sp.]MDN5776906.1 pyridoxamine 5'-phosphate oxidase family protein [Humibacillus sp.]